MQAIPLNHSLASWLASQTAEVRSQILRSLPADTVRDLRWNWRFWARAGQLVPGSAGAQSDRQNWVHWIPLAGRGWGKTRVGAETVKLWAEDPEQKIHLIGPTSASVRSVMIDGPSGLMSCYPPDRRPVYEASKHRIIFPSGAIGETFSADEPERLRGPACSKYWADEPCAWRFLEEAWDNHMFGFRLGNDLRGICTTTPRPLKWLKAMIASPDTITTRHSSYENRQNVAAAFLNTIVTKYEGTRLGRQELLAEILEDVPGALWTRQVIDDHRITLGEVHMDRIIRIVIAVDPAVSHNPDSDETGIIVAGLTDTGHGLVLEDLSCKESAAGWARIVLRAYYKWRADVIVGEVNNGGDLVERNIFAEDSGANFRAVRASRGKYKRFEPVAALAERGRLHHVGIFPDLEEQMVSWTPQGNEDSPDRLDAMAWGFTELIVDPEESEAVHQFAQPYRITA